MGKKPNQMVFSTIMHLYLIIPADILFINYSAYFSALYDFDAKNYGELSIFEGQKIDLLSQLDDEWYEGRVDGTIGYFPINYVKILVPLPK